MVMAQSMMKKNLLSDYSSSFQFCLCFALHTMFVFVFAMFYVVLHMLRNK